MKTPYLLIGEILKPQGIRGEVKLRAESEDLSRYSKLSRVFLSSGEDFVEYHVESGRASAGFAYLKLQGISDRNAAEELRNLCVYVRREEAITPEEGRYFVSDLIGCKAFDEDGNEIGSLKDVQSPNAFCDVYIFETPRGEMMMPALKKVIRSIDIDQERMILDSAVLEEIALWPDSDSVVE